MTPKKAKPTATPDARIAELVQAIHAAERELQALTAGELDAVVTPEQQPDQLREAQEDLRLSEAAQRTLAETQINILNALPAHIALLDRDGVIVVVNEAWRLFASANVLRIPDFSVGQNYIGVCETAHGECAEESQAVVRGIRQVLSGAESFFTLEYPCHSPTEKRWFRLMVTPLIDQPGAGAVVMHVNVTERRMAEEALRETEREQRRLAETLSAETQRLHASQAVANVGSWETNLATNEVTWTEETYRIFEVSPVQFQPSHQRFLEMVHPDDRAKVGAAFVISHGRAEAFAIEHRICLPGGRIKVLEERWQAFSDEKGQPDRAIGTCHDITARTIAEEALRMRAREQEVIARIGLEATRATTLEGIFDFTTRVVAEALDVELCKVLRLGPDGSHLRLVSGVGWQPGLVGVATVGVEEASQAGFTLKSAGPIFVNDLRIEKRFQAPPLLTQHKVISGLSVTIPLLGKAWGVLGAHCRSVRSFDEHDAQFMQSVAMLLAVVIERLAAQRSVTESERRMRDAQRIAQLGNWEMEVATNALIWSDEVYRIFGVTPDNFAGTFEAFRALIHPEDRDRMDAAQRRTLAGEAILDIEHRIIRPGGEIRHVRERGELIHDEQHRPVVLSGTVLDITEMVQAQETRRMAEELSSAIVASALDAIITIDHENRILEFNPSAEGIFGWPKAAVLGRDLSEVIIPERLRDAHRRGMARYLVTGEKRTLDRRLELPAIRADGTEIVIELNATRLGESTPPQFTAFLRDITQSKRAEGVLRTSEERFRALFDQAAVGMCLVSSEGRFLSTNPRFCEIVGYSAEELLAQNSIETTHPDDRAGEAEITARMLAGELQTSNWEKRFVHRDGRVVWCNLTLALMPPRTGEAQQFVGVIDDISERKKAETATKGLLQTQQELATSDLPVQALMELIAERARELTDAAGGVVELVDGAELVYTAGAGMAADKIGLRFKREGSLSELALKTHSVLKADDTETDPRCDRVACRQIGARSMVVVPLVRVGTEFVGVLKVMSDRPAAFTDRDVNNLQILTETLGAVIQRQRAAERLLQTVERFDRATHAGGLGVWDWDVQTNHLVWDDRLYQIYGLRREDFSNAYEAWATTVHPADLGRTDAEVQAALRGEKEFDTEFRTVWPDGSIHHIYAVGHVVRDADGTPLRMTGFNADITERKKLEAQFLRAQRMESVGTLASGIAHDMNNILAPIMMSVQLLKEDSEDEATLDMLSTLESCSRRGADLVRQLLSFTRGFDGQQVAVDLTLVIRELQKVMKEVFPKDVQFEISAGRDLWTTVGDPSQLHQVLLNLCVNARDAMPRGGKLMIELENIVLDEFYVAMNPDGKAGGYVVIGVSDTGTGIAPAVLDKIFEPFFTTKELGKGTGLGLSTVIGIVKNHGGFVTVYSEVGKGTQFKVYLPAQTSETQLEEVSVTQSGIPRGNGELILLVDDERGVRQVAVKTLVRFGYRVVEAANGAEAVALYVQHQQDVALVLTDVSMPIMDGVALITALRSVNPQVRIVVSSGLPFSGGVARAVEFGVRHFIPKPYTADKLLGIIHQELHS